MTEQILKEYFSKLGRVGGKERSKNTSADYRKQLARKAARARWDKAKGKEA